MAMFLIQARRIESKRVTGGWESSGVEVPTFGLDAVDAEAAAELAHTILGTGLRSLSQTTVTAYGEDSDGFEDMVTSVQYWADGKKVDPTEVKRQYAQDGDIIDGSPYAEDDADSVTWFTADGGVWLALARSPRGKWMFDFSEYVNLRQPDQRRRFATPDEALEHAQWRAGAVVSEVTSWV